MAGVHSLGQHAAKHRAGFLKMFLELLVLENSFHAAGALFSVNVPKPSYTVEMGSQVAMECSFPVKTQLNMEELMITWLHTTPSQSGQKEVCVLQKGEEDLSHQNEDFIGRASLLKEKLYQGAAVLQINNTKCSDNGTYICLIGYRGADYKYIDLKVTAPYAKIETYTELAAEGGELVLTCKAEGFPMAEVYWQEASTNISTQLNTSYTLTADGLYKVTSTLRVTKKAKNNYRCLFWNKELQKTTSENLFPSARHDAAVAKSTLPWPYIVGPVCAALLIIMIMYGVIILKRRVCQKMVSNENEHCKPPNSEVRPLSSHFQEGLCEDLEKICI